MASPASPNPCQVIPFPSEHRREHPWPSWPPNHISYKQQSNLRSPEYPAFPSYLTVSDEFISIFSTDLIRLCFPWRYLIMLSPYLEPLWIEWGKKMRRVMRSDINWSLIFILLTNPWVTPGKSVRLFSAKITSPWKTGKRTMYPWRWLWGVVSKMKLIKEKWCVNQMVWRNGRNTLPSAQTNCSSVLVAAQRFSERWCEEILNLSTNAESP